MSMRPAKRAWQRRQRQEFAAQHGYSTAAHYATGGLRERVLQRDGYRCVRCGMTAEEHMARWGRPITVDHIDKDRTHNSLDNLQTLCLRCHGSKDISRSLITPLAPEYKQTILRLRKQGRTYREIAHSIGLSVGAVWKWVQRWQQEEGA
jgi:Sigma-70, region 4./HNH endonuclease.